MGLYCYLDVAVLIIRNQFFDYPFDLEDWIGCQSDETIRGLKHLL